MLIAEPGKSVKSTDTARRECANKKRIFYSESRGYESQRIWKDFRHTCAVYSVGTFLLARRCHQEKMGKMEATISESLHLARVCRLSRIMSVTLNLKGR
ncbi:MAG: hypothetical protein D6704_11415 [Nitrospirae bacterium]|nr:MAG: hypothetical protein D6704_11415 [Nitrospirota bacterium]